MNFWIKHLCISVLIAFGAIATAHAQFSTVYSPTAPLSMKFAGDNIDLDRTDRHERLERELTAMAYTHGNTMLTIKRANRYFPMFERVFKRAGVPTDMIYIACVESYLDPLAYSPAKAAGMWQFMPSTAKEYGLEVNDEVDERYHPEKAAEAATRYFKKCYARYGNWESVAAAYNAGTARISSQLDEQGVDTAFDLYLNRETSRYIYRLLAMKAVMENPKAFGYHLTPDQLYQPVEVEYVAVSDSVPSWIDWAKQHGMTYLQLREANPWIRASSLTNKNRKTYQVAVLKDKSQKQSKIKPKTYNHNWVK